MSDSIDTVVIGAGVVGLAIARELALAGREVIVLEKNAAIGEETSARNSEVIHAGLYYPRGSLKARFCVEGRERLYEYCEAKHVPHRRCGKLLVATHAGQVGKLETVRAAAATNGVTELEMLSVHDVQRLEPQVHALAGLLSPSTGIIDSHAFMLALQGDLEAAGGAIATHCRFTAAAKDAAKLRLTCDTADGPFTLSAGTVVNAAGLHATRVAQLLGAAEQTIPRTHFAKGSYFTYTGRSPFTRLVYPLPEDGGLGVHATLDLAGRVRFGPDVEWLAEGVDPESLDYAVDPARAAAFYGAIRSYWPALPDGGLSSAYSGIRPKISGRGEAAADFSVRVRTERGSASLAQLFGIESPGLTSALAIGAHVAELLRAV
ncbi:MAG: NAD(P)/FAD-dependent oxidoreductase [Gammaproteobacteria bacterium]